MLIPVIASIFTLLIGEEISALLYNESTQQASREPCMKDGLGCFPITDDFIDYKNRPRLVNVYPNDRATINTRCLLYTRQYPKESHQLIAWDKKSFDESHFDPKFPVIFIVHGFMDSEFYGPWMVKMKDEFLMSGDYNVIIVDWSGGNKAPYFQATANTRVVGAEIDILIQSLEKYTGIRRENCHIIGHSLGAHIAGYAGARLKKLGRITGCDPAEPYFQHLPPSVRLDPTDADFVDVIHTDATDVSFVGFGMSHPVGHVDFYPNSGKNQPGCKKDKYKTFITEGLIEGIRRFASCNHQRALDFMHHSINYRKITPVGFECTSWEDFDKGKCAGCGPDTRRCAIMGIRADEYKPFKNSSVHHMMYLKTSEKSPFWQYHYQVSIKLFKPKTSHKDLKGTIDITLFGSKADELFHIEKEATDLYHGARYQYLVTTDKELGDIKSVSLKWFLTWWKPFDYFKKLYVEYITVTPMNSIEKSPRNMTNLVFCDKPNNGIASKTTAHFLRDNCSK